MRVKAPMLRVHTVAAGGGSLCRFDGFRLTVGPESAGADPGPLCYGRPGGARAGAHRREPRARPRAARPLPVPARARAGRRARSPRSRRALARGGPRAHARRDRGGLRRRSRTPAWREAISQVSIARGVDPRGCALVGFGGAGGQHVCALARALGMRDVVLHPLAGILSAWGIGMADVSWDGQRDAGRVPLPADGEPLPAPVRAALDELGARRARGAARARASPAARSAIEREPRPALRRHRDARSRCASPPTALRRGLRARARDALRLHARGTRRSRSSPRACARRRGARAGGAVARRRAARPPRAAPLRREPRLVPRARAACATPVYRARGARAGRRARGSRARAGGHRHDRARPGLPRCASRAGGVLRAARTSAARAAARRRLDAADPVRLEVFGHRFMSIAEQMGAVLRNTSVSTNIKERLDYSCAVFDARRRAGRQRAAHPGAPRRDGRDGARRCASASPISRRATSSSPTIRSRAARTCPT